MTYNYCVDVRLILNREDTFHSKDLFPNPSHSSIVKACKVTGDWNLGTCIHPIINSQCRFHDHKSNHTNNRDGVDHAWLALVVVAL